MVYITKRVTFGQKMHNETRYIANGLQNHLAAAATAAKQTTHSTKYRWFVCSGTGRNVITRGYASNTWYIAAPYPDNLHHSHHGISPKAILMRASRKSNRPIPRVYLLNFLFVQNETKWCCFASLVYIAYAKLGQASAGNNSWWNNRTRLFVKQSILLNHNFERDTNKIFEISTETKWKSDCWVFLD